MDVERKDFRRPDRLLSTIVQAGYTLKKEMLNQVQIWPNFILSIFKLQASKHTKENLASKKFNLQ